MITTNKLLIYFAGESRVFHHGIACIICIHMLYFWDLTLNTKPTKNISAVRKGPHVVEQVPELSDTELRCISGLCFRYTPQIF